MSNQSYKSVALRDELSSSLAVRLSALSRTKGFDSSQNPTLQLGAGTAGTQSAFIRIKPLDSINVDVLGLAQNVWTPHIVQLVLETSSVAGVQLLLMTTLGILMPALASIGARLEVYMSANGTAADASQITAANLKSTFDLQVQYPLAGQ
jgi:hypothetical protein